MSIQVAPSLVVPSNRCRVIVGVCLMLLLPSVALAQLPPAGEEQARKAEETLEGLRLENVIPGNPLEVETWRRAGQHLFTRFVDAIPDMFYGLIVAVLFVILYFSLRRVMQGMFRRQGADPALTHLSVQLLKYTLMVLGTIMVANQLGFQIGSVLAAAGVAGLAIGLAAQNTISNVIAGLTLLWDRPFRTGDNVTIADTFGQVMHVGLRATHIRTIENMDAFLPNRVVVEEKIVNHTQSPRLRLPVPLGIAYWEDVREARRVLLEVAREHPGVAEAPEPQLVVIGLGDSSVDLELRCWLRDPHAERIMLCELLEASKLALDEAGITIPFPQRTLHLANEHLVTDFLPQRQAS